MIMENKKVEWILRIAIAGEFLGHGLLATGGKADWIKWIQFFVNVDTALATQLLFIVGLSDILVALILLVRPTRSVLLWAAVWGFWTALVRPIVGVGWLDFIERFANWGAPLALLLLYGWPRSWKEWWTRA